MSAAAQTAREPRARASVSAGAQADPAFSEALVLQRNVEDAPVSVAAHRAVAPWIDAGLIVRVHKRVGAGVAVSYAAATTAGGVAAQIPHPFVFGRLRPIQGQVAGLGRHETSVHGEIAWFVPARGPIDLTIAGGPSVVHVKQDLVSDVRFQEVYPYDTATFQQALTTPRSGTGVGFNVSADVRWRRRRAAGVGVVVRYARATVRLGPDASPTTALRAGGLQAGAGLRFTF